MTTFTFTLPLSADCADYTAFAHGFVSNLGTIEVYVSGHCIDGGDLGQLEIDLEDVEVDLSDAIGDYAIGNAVREAKNEGACGEDFTQEVTLTEIREAYCKEHGCSPYEFLAAVGEEIAIAAMNDRDRAVRHELRQEVERAKASVHADTLVVEQSIQDRNKAQELYGKQVEQMREAVKLLAFASSQMRDPSGGMSFMSEDEQLRDTTSKQIRDFLTKAVWYETETEAETTPDTTTDAEA
jgi:hypothetical protein